MRITNFGSCSIDNVYSVPHFVNPGETLPCSAFHVHPGGKGLNQSLALAYAGAEVRHAGKVGRDGTWLKTLLVDAGVDVSTLVTSEEPSGHAVIQVTPDGKNSIVIFGGANTHIDEGDIDSALQQTEPGEFLLIQNEISSLPMLMRSARQRKLRVVFNAAPMTAAVASYPLTNVEMFIVNELEGEALTGRSQPDDILKAMLRQYPGSRVILTRGEWGASYADANQRFDQLAYPVNALDTTGAGDTFTGYFLAAFIAGKPIPGCLELGCKAAAACVTRRGAATSIPRRGELDQEGIRQ